MTEQDSNTEQRREERLQTSVSAFIKWKLNKNDELIEEAAITSLSRMGAGFQLSHPCVIGRLVTLALPMERELRAHDLDEELYTVVGLVQYCNPRIENGKQIYDIGAAFTGRMAPPSYEENPEQSYRVTGINESGLWQIQEQDRPFKARKHTRYHTRLNVILTLIRKSHSDNQARKEHSITRDISVSGASFPCSLDVKIGDKVKFACEEHNFYCFAVVRNRNETLSIPASVHLEFVEAKFPIEKIASLVPVQEDTARPEREQGLRAEAARPIAPPPPVEKPVEQPAIAEAAEHPVAEEPVEDLAEAPAVEEQPDQPVAEEQLEELADAAEEQSDQPVEHQAESQMADEPVEQLSEEETAEAVNETSWAESKEQPAQSEAEAQPEGSEAEAATEAQAAAEAEAQAAAEAEAQAAAEAEAQAAAEAQAEAEAAAAAEAEAEAAEAAARAEAEAQAQAEAQAEAEAEAQAAAEAEAEAEAEAQAAAEAEAEAEAQAAAEAQAEAEAAAEAEAKAKAEAEAEAEAEAAAAAEAAAKAEARAEAEAAAEAAAEAEAEAEAEAAAEAAASAAHKPWEEPVNESEVREYVYEPENELQEYAYEPQIVDDANEDEPHEYAYVADVITDVIEEGDADSRSDEKGWSAETADNPSSDPSRR
jgi:hypothetical protein